jgi:glycerol uptake facilitator-like aquaporin
MTPLRTRLLAEFLGTAFLLATVVGSGIMAERLAQGNGALALLCNSTATALGLFALISALGDVSGAHFNPVVTVVSVFNKRLSGIDGLGYVVAQVTGAFVGVATANLMFGLSTFTPSHTARGGGGLLLGEFVATIGLLSVIELCSSRRPAATPAAVAAYIGAAYWFTSSTSFANPAVTLGRMATDTFAGIRPASAPAFVGAQLAALAVVIVAQRLLRRK